MPTFDASATSEDVVSAFQSSVAVRTFVITGAGKPSIGSSIATAIAKASPAHILIASRTKSKVDAVFADIGSIDPSIKTTFVPIDLGDHESVRAAAAEILAATGSKIDVLINSAGNMAVKDYKLDKQGIESQFSANHVGHFLLTNLLVPALEVAAAANPQQGARVVNLTSSGYRISPVLFEDLNFSNGQSYDLWTGYGQAKTANILFAHGLSERLKQRGVTAYAAHPGSNLDTNLGTHLTMDDYKEVETTAKRNTGKDYIWDEPRFKSLAQIGATPMVAALDPDLVAVAPVYLHNSAPAEVDDMATKQEYVDKLWQLSEKLVGQRFTY